MDKTFYEQTAENTEYFDDVPSTAGLYLDGDRTPRDVGSIIRNVDLANATAGSAAWARTASTRARSPKPSRPPLRIRRSSPMPTTTGGPA